MKAPQTDAPPDDGTDRGGQRHFALLRYFAIAGLLSTLAAAVALGLLYRHQAVSELIDEAHFDNAALAHVLSIQIRDEMNLLLQPPADRDRAELVRHIDGAVRTQAKPFRAAKVKIYAPNGETVFSTVPAEIGNDASQNTGVQSALQGQVSSSLVHRDQFNAFDQVVANRDLLQTYLPVRNADESAVIGVFELYSDMTGLLARIRRTERTVMGSVALTMLLLYGVLFAIVRRADGIIKRQEESLREHVRLIAQQNQELEDRVRQRTAELETANRELVAEIGERESTQKALQLARQQAWEQDKLAAIGRLSAGIVHEIGNPLAAARGLLDAMTEAVEADDPATALEMRHQLMEQVRRMEAITREVSIFAVPEPVEPELLNLNELLRLVANVLRYDAKLRDIRIDLDLDPDLPALTGVSNRLWQMAINLILNAADAIARKPGAERRIVVRTARQDGQALLTVHDEGDGMDEATMAKAFEPFHTTKPPGQGRGIGLSQCYAIVQSSGGWISIDSRRGIGTTVSITLPLGDAVSA